MDAHTHTFIHKHTRMYHVVFLDHKRFILTVQIKCNVALASDMLWSPIW